MGIIIIKLVGKDSTTINGDSIAYAEGGNVLEVLNEEEEILAVYRNWEYAVVHESEEEYQRSLLAELDDEEDEDLEDDEDLEGEDEGEEDGEKVTTPTFVRGNGVIDRLAADPTLTLEQFDENAARSESQS